MRKVVSATVALLSLAIFAPSAAFAEPSPAPSAEATRTPFEQYRIDRDAFNNAIKMRNLAIKNINMAFKNACDKAALDFKSAMSTARTPDQKNQAVTARKNAISAAIVARDAAITSLGAEPVPPIEPIKAMKPSSKNKSR